MLSAVKPYWISANATANLYHGDALSVLACLPEQSVHCAITSPPYWGLRDYGIDGQLGSEPTPEEYVEKIVAVFREVRRVLRDDGTCWLNLGDAYSQGKKGAAHGFDPKNKEPRIFGVRPNENGGSGVSSGNLVGVPWRVAFALQSDGWILRQDIVWRKPSPMPESVKNRCTKAHEYVFLLTKSNKYFYDKEAVKEQSANPKASEARYRSAFGGAKAETLTAEEAKGAGSRTHPIGNRAFTGNRNKRDVWDVDDERALHDWLSINAPEQLQQFLLEAEDKTDVWSVTSQGYPGAHYATFPPKLITPMILAGTSSKGCCGQCFTPFVRQTKKTGGSKVAEDKTGDRDRSYVWSRNGITGSLDGEPPTIVTTGWAPACKCRSGGAVPCTVLDPFLGSGTTVAVALTYGRIGVGIELNRQYLDNDAIPRIKAAE